MIASLLRRACAALALAVPLAVSSGIAAAAFAPQKPVELVVHTGPGGGNDVLARAIVDDGGEGEPAAGAHRRRQQAGRQRRGRRRTISPKRRATRMCWGSSPAPGSSAR